MGSDPVKAGRRLRDFFEVECPSIIVLRDFGGAGAPKKKNRHGLVKRAN